jgi:hypothetical protein
MKSIIIAIIAVVIGSCCLAGCSAGHRGPVTSSGGADLQTTSTVQRNQGPATSGGDAHLPTTASVRPEAFTWQPEIHEKYGSDAANRCAYGIVDGDGITLYYQALNDDGDSLYSLYSYNEQINNTEKLVNDCGGMVNVNGEYVFYVGYDDKGVFRYGTESNVAKRLYSGEVQNLLVVKDYLYIVDADYRLRQMDLVSGDMTIGPRRVAAHYLEYQDGYVYFGRMNPDAANCDLHRVEVGKVEKTEQVCQGIGYPMGCVGTQVLYGDNEGVELRDWNTGAKSTVFLKGNGAALAAVNGNGVFYVTHDIEGYSELRAFDLTSKTTSVLMPVHCGTVYFVKGKMYLVDPVSLGFERAVLETGSPHTEWVIERESGAS